METTGNDWNNQPEAEPTVADMHRFPAFKRNPQKEIAPQIAQHLAKYMEQSGPDASISIRIPAAISLSEFYGCSPLDVLDGLYAFRQKNYEYMMNGLDSEITLNSLPHNLTVRSKTFWHGPWELTHKIAESPLINLFQGKAG
jgi:hypothetical protein